MDVVSYGGWSSCARLETQNYELLVTLEVGPRIIRLAPLGGDNLLHEDLPDLGKTGGSDYRSYGGHRLWIGPEDSVRTMQPDNEPVHCGTEGGWTVFRSRPDRFGMQKEMALQTGEGDCLKLRHRVYNTGAYEVQFCPWTLTVMASGGTCMFPHAQFKPFPEQLLPVRPLVLWSYVRMDDDRWDWGPDLVRLRQAHSRDPQKVGMLVRQGYAAYANKGHTFLKRFACIDNVEYPDFGCNFETYTNGDFLEVESLGPIGKVAAGGYTEHNETWYVVNEVPPDGNASAARWLSELAQPRPHWSEK